MKKMLLAIAMLVLGFAGCSDAETAKAKQAQAEAELAKIKAEVELAKLKANPDAQTPAKSPELSWSREVATLFLNSLVKPDGLTDIDQRYVLEGALAYVSEEYLQRLKAKYPKDPRSANYVLGWQLYGDALAADNTNGFFRSSYKVYKLWSIDAESLSPNRNEALFLGILKDSDSERVAAFKLFVTTETKTNKWRVNDFRLEPK